MFCNFVTQHYVLTYVLEFIVSKLLNSYNTNETIECSVSMTFPLLITFDARENFQDYLCTVLYSQRYKNFMLFPTRYRK